MTPSERQSLRSLAERSTRVVKWYAHGPSDGAGATVRGPYHRWFDCREVDPRYKSNVADPKDDCEYAAAAMNAVPDLLDLVERYEGVVNAAREYLNQPGMSCYARVNNWVKDKEEKRRKLGEALALLEEK